MIISSPACYLRTTTGAYLLNRYHLRTTTGTYLLNRYHLRTTTGAYRLNRYHLRTTTGAYRLNRYHLRTTTGTYLLNRYHLRTTTGTYLLNRYHLRTTTGTYRLNRYHLRTTAGAYCLNRYHFICLYQTHYVMLMYSLYQTHYVNVVFSTTLLSTEYDIVNKILFIYFKQYIAHMKTRNVFIVVTVNVQFNSIQFNTIYSRTDDRSPKDLVCQTTKIRLVQHNVFTILGKNIFTKVQ